MRKILFLAMALLLMGTSSYTFAAVIVPVNPPTSVEPDPAKVKSAMSEFKSLSRKDRKERVRDAKREIKAYRAEKKSGQEPSTNMLLLVILAILLPPLAVYLHEGEINNRFWISLLLTLLFWLPGVIYALILILGDN